MQINVVSGICPVTHLGAGRLLRWIEMQRANVPNWKIIYASAKSLAGEALRRRNTADLLRSLFLHIYRVHRLRYCLQSLGEEPALLLLHFQEIGSEWCSKLLKTRRRKEPVWIYLFDSSFFCRKSYNYIDPEPGACLRCQKGRFDEADRHRCEFFPNRFFQSAKFLRLLFAASAERRVGFFAQNERQKRVALQHFGPKSIIEVVGVWTDDMEYTVDEFLRARTRGFDQTFSGRDEVDIVFHGAPIHAKGFAWTLRLAEKLNHLRFFFPCPPPERHSCPKNCEFRAMSWESGLRDAVASACVTIVPSLWSSPVEGALVKSILLSRRTAVINEPTSFASELDDKLVIKLSPDIEIASKVIDSAVRKKEETSMHIKSLWLEDYKRNRDFLLKIQECIRKTLEGPRQ